MLGEISAMSQLIAEYEENENTIPTDKLFLYIYQCYDLMMKFAKTKELALRFVQLKQTKRTNAITIVFLSGVIGKCRQALSSMKCFS